MIPRSFKIREKELIINQNLDFDYAGQVWDAAMVFAYFLNNEKSSRIFDPKGKTVLELGSGTGILGLTTGVLGAKKIILTDKQGHISLISKNYEENKKNFSKDLICEILELDWLHPNDRKKINDEVDYIIGSDIVWDPKLRTPLFDVINHFMTQSTKVFLSFEIRDDEIVKFLSLFTKDKFEISYIPDELYDEQYKAEEIKIISIKKK